MLVTLQEILEIAEKGSFAIPAFNVYNVETAMGVTHSLEYIFGALPPNSCILVERSVLPRLRC